MTALAAVIIVGVGTYLTRLSMVVALDRITLGDRAERALGLIPPAVLAALVAQTLVLDGDAVRSLSSWHPAAAAAALVAWRTRSIGWTLLTGMVVLWTIQALAG